MYELNDIIEQQQKVIQDKEKQKKIVSKWSPVIESLGVKDENMILYMSEYAEHHSTIDLKIESVTPPKTTFNDNLFDSISSNLLPVALKLLSTIKLENKNFAIADSSVMENEKLETFNYFVPLSIKNEESHPFRIIRSKSTDPDIIQENENILVEKAAESINMYLQNFNTLVVYRLVSEIKIERQETGIFMVLNSRIMFKNI